MTSIVSIFFAVFVFTIVQVEVHTFSTTRECIDDVVNLVKEKRGDLATEYCLSNSQSSESLRNICEYYVPHKVHKVLRLVNGVTCNAEIPTRSKLEQSIYDSYVGLLQQLKIYEGSVIPNSFGQHNDYIIGMTRAVFDRTADRLAGICLHTTTEEID